METNVIEDRRDGYTAGKTWLEHATETERAELAAVFAGGGFRIHLSADTFPTLGSALGPSSTDSVEVNFSSSPWLSGFRDALVEDLGGEPG